MIDLVYDEEKFFYLTNNKLLTTGYVMDYKPRKKVQFRSPTLMAVNVSMKNNNALKNQLQEEIAFLSQKLEEVKSSDNCIDLGLIQSYSSMIGSRRKFFKQLVQNAKKY